MKKTNTKKTAENTEITRQAVEAWTKAANDAMAAADQARAEADLALAKVDGWVKTALEPRATLVTDSVILPVVINDITPYYATVEGADNPTVKGRPWQQICDDLGLTILGQKSTGTAARVYFDKQSAAKLFDLAHKASDEDYAHLIAFKAGEVQAEDFATAAAATAGGESATYAPATLKGFFQNRVKSFEEITAYKNRFSRKTLVAYLAIIVGLYLAGGLVASVLPPLGVQYLAMTGGAYILSRIIILFFGRADFGGQS